MQLEQAITEARSAHIRLQEQAANVIANQKQSELRLNSKLTELEKLNANARQALVMAADAEKAGDATKASQYNIRRRDDRQPADPGREGRREPQDDGARVGPGIGSGEGGGPAEQPAPAGEDRREVQAAQSQLDQAKMQEEMNSAMAQLNEHIGADVPSFEEVREKIEARYARAKAASELSEASVESRCSRSSRRPPTSRRRAGSASCVPSSASSGRRHRLGRRRQTRPQPEQPHPRRGRQPLAECRAPCRRRHVGTRAATATWHVRLQPADDLRGRVVDVDVAEDHGHLGRPRRHTRR